MDQIRHSFLSLQSIVGAAERLSRRVYYKDRNIDWMVEVETLRDRLTHPPFEARPMRGYIIKTGDKERLVAKPDLNDHLLQETILSFMSTTAEKILPDAVFSFRPGRSTFKAALSVRNALSSGYHLIGKYDISDFFPSVDRAKLQQILASVFPRELCDMLNMLVSTRILMHDESMRESRGLPLGQPVSPVLSNLYLRDVDMPLATRPDIVYLRYGDDIIILSKTEESLISAEQTIREIVGSLFLTLNESKTQRLSLQDGPVLYLGHLVDEKGVYERLSDMRISRMLSREPESRELQPSGPVRLFPKRSQTLYVTEPGAYMHMKEGLVVVKKRADILRELPLHRIDRILMLSGVSMSSGFLSQCIERNIPVLFFVKRGKSYGSLVASESVNPLRIRAQYDILSNAGWRLTLACSIILAKLNAMIFRLSRIRESENERNRLLQMKSKIGRVKSFDALRGLEGTATHVYYQGFAKRIRHPGFEFTVRSRRPPRDPINSLMSFTYAVLFGEMQTALLACGLDPHIGLFHELRKSHLALASDLIEPYRHLIGDSFVLKLVNNRMVKTDGFVEGERKAVYMHPDTRRLVLVAFEDFMRKPLKPGSSDTFSFGPRHLITLAAHAMLRIVIGETQELVLPLKEVHDANWKSCDADSDDI